MWKFAITTVFGDTVMIETFDLAYGKRVVYNRDTSSADFATKWAVPLDRENNQSRNVSFALRHSEKSVTTRKLPENVTVENILEGDCGIYFRLSLWA